MYFNKGLTIALFLCQFDSGSQTPPKTVHTRGWGMQLVVRMWKKHIRVVLFSFVLLKLMNKIVHVF